MQEHRSCKPAPESLHLPGGKNRKVRSTQSCRPSPLEILYHHSRPRYPPHVGGPGFALAAGRTKKEVQLEPPMRGRHSPPPPSRWPDISEHPEKNTNRQVFMRAVTQLTKASSLSLEMSLLWTSCLANKPHVSTLQNPISEQCDSDRSRDMIQFQGAFEHLLNS